jgi:CSLREA domain-containing protein
MTASEYHTRSILAALCLLVAALTATIAVLMALSATPAKAAVPGTTITVNTTADESNTKGDCSLREAIKAANTNSAVDGCRAGSATKRDAIRFSLGEQATIVLVSKLPNITDASRLTINGGRKAQITVSGDGKVRVFSESKDAKLALANLTVADGFADTFDNGNSTKGIPGGGIVNRGGTLKVTNSTFSRNSAVLGGGAIANIEGGTLRVINSTFYGNVSTYGGAIVNTARLEVSYSTFSANYAEFYGAILNANNKAATMRLSSTVLANNINDNIVNVCTGLPPAEQCRGTITDGGYNISDDLSFSFTKRTSKSNTDPKLDPDGLQSNGGPTATIALLEGSPAIDHIPSGENGCGAIVKTDQRWVQRPQGEGCDVGSFEKEQQ